MTVMANMDGRADDVPLSDEIDWPKFNRWVRHALVAMGFNHITEVRPVIRIGDHAVRVYVRHDGRESHVSLPRKILIDVGIVREKHCGHH